MKINIIEIIILLAKKVIRFQWFMKHRINSCLIIVMKISLLLFFHLFVVFENVFLGLELTIDIFRSEWNFFYKNLN